MAPILEQMPFGIDVLKAQGDMLHPGAHHPHQVPRWSRPTGSWDSILVFYFFYALGGLVFTVWIWRVTLLHFGGVGVYDLDLGNWG